MTKEAGRKTGRKAERSQGGTDEGSSIKEDGNTKKVSLVLCILIRTSQTSKLTNLLLQTRAQFSTLLLK